MKYIVYGLFDKYGNVRYIGMSTSGLIRPRKHLNPSSYNSSTKRHYHVYNWIRKEIDEGYVPSIKVLEETNKENLYKKEQFWIRYFKKKNIKLTNKVDGGPGMLGLSHTEETKRLIKEKKKGIMPCDYILNMFKSQKGEKHPNFGRKASEELRKKLSDSHKGYIPTEEQKRKIRAALKGKPKGPQSEEHRRKNGLTKAKPIKCNETGEVFESIKQASKIIPCKTQTLINNLKKRPSTPTVKGYTFSYLNEENQNG